MKKDKISPQKRKIEDEDEDEVEEPQEEVEEDEGIIIYKKVFKRIFFKSMQLLARYLHYCEPCSIELFILLEDRDST
jgi:hypothetical protein